MISLEEIGELAIKFVEADRLIGDHSDTKLATAKRKLYEAIDSYNEENEESPYSC